MARVLEVPRELIVRVKAAFELIEDARLVLNPACAQELPEELRVAYSSALRRGVMRMKTRHAIRDGENMYAPVKKLVKTPEQVCRGCPHSIRCVAEQLALPNECFKHGPVVSIRDDLGWPGHRQLMRVANAKVSVSPIQIRGDAVTVECAHPSGRYVLDVGDLAP